MPAEVGDTVFIVVIVAVGIVTGGACWVQPAMKIPATMQRPRIIKMLFVVVMIYRKRFCDGCVKISSVPEDFFMPDNS
jgi:hypothetical protein